MISTGEFSLTKKDILKQISEWELFVHYTGITTIPCRINSPFRIDHTPSVGFYRKGDHILWTDFSDNTGGDMFVYLSKLWNLPYDAVLDKIQKDLKSFSKNMHLNTVTSNYLGNGKTSMSDLKCSIRKWKDYDLEYWKSYGITKPWLEFASIYPVSQIIIVKGNDNFVFPADKYAYAYVEFKEGKTTLKIYQPFNTNGYKWANKHDKSVISLWTKMPKTGDKLCVCASLKDALCLWANTGIPAISPQGEGYPISNSAIKALKERFKNIYILLDNDKPGLADGVKLAELTGFKNLVLPAFEGGKDISDFYKVTKNKTNFYNTLINLFK